MRLKKLISFFLIVALAACSGGGKSGGDATGVGSISTGDKNAEKYLWSFDAGSAIRSTATVTRELVYFGTHTGNLYALDRANGKQRWMIDTGGSVTGDLLLADGKIIFINGSGKIQALNSRDGELIWSLVTGGESYKDEWDYHLGSAIVAENIVYIGSSNGILYGLDLATGAETWRYDLGSPIHTKPVLVGDKLYVSSARGLHCLSIFNGNEIWSRALEMPRSPAVAAGTVVVGSRDEHVYAYRADTGEPVWSVSHGTSWVTGGAAIRNNVAYIGSSDDRKYQAINISDGRVLWSINTDGNVFSTPRFEGDISYITSGNAYSAPGTGYIKAVAADGNIIWSLKGKNFFSSPMIHEGVLFLGSDDGHFYAVDVLDAPL